MTSLNSALQEFYLKHGFGSDIGKRKPLTVKVYTGCMLVPLPNIEARRKYLTFHDLHHLVTGFSVGRIGEGKMSAWELGTGTFLKYPTLGLMNLIALSTGLFLKPRDMWNSFLLGKTSKNLYSKSSRQSINFDQMDLPQLGKQVFIQKNYKINFLTKLEFGFYSFLAVIIHAVLVIPALALRSISDFVQSGSLIETIKPKKRKDLF